MSKSTSPTGETPPEPEADGQETRSDHKRDAAEEPDDDGWIDA
jgi:hypothetical protein